MTDVPRTHCTDYLQCVLFFVFNIILISHDDNKLKRSKVDWNGKSKMKNVV